MILGIIIKKIIIKLIKIMEKILKKINIKVNLKINKNRIFKINLTIGNIILKNLDLNLDFKKIIMNKINNMINKTLNNFAMVIIIKDQKAQIHILVITKIQNLKIIRKLINFKEQKVQNHKKINIFNIDYINKNIKYKILYIIKLVNLSK